jgi:hypothetical protein
VPPDRAGGRAAFDRERCVISRPSKSEPDPTTLPARDGKLQAQRASALSIGAAVLQLGSSPEMGARVGRKVAFAFWNGTRGDARC